MEQLLTNSGMSNSLDKPDPIPCEFCGENKPQIEVEHPFKKVMSWVYCVCPCVTASNEEFKRDQELKEKRIRINRALKLSSAMDDIKSMTFDNYKIRPGTESAYQEVRAAVDEFDKRGKLGVFIFGETGNGKSHITAAGGNELIEKGHSVIFIAEKDLLSRLQATRNFNNKESFGEIMNACLEADLLIWDDFMSSQRLSPDEKDWIFQIVNGRERANKPIWYTSNITTVEFNNDLTPYKLDDKGRTWWRILGNSECIYNQASNHRKAYATARAMGISVEEYESRMLSND